MSPSATQGIPDRQVEGALRLLAGMIWRQPLLCTGWLASLLASTATTLALPVALRYLMDKGFVDPSKIDAAFIPMAVVGVLLALTTSCRMYFVSEMGERVVATLRKDTFERILARPMAFHHATPSAELLSRLTTDAEHLRIMLGAAVSIALRAAITICGAAVMLIATSPRLALWAAVAIALAVVPIAFRSRRLRGLTRRSQDLIARSVAIASEAITAVRTVKEFVREDHERARYRAAIDDAARCARQRVVMQSVLAACAIGTVFGAVLLVLWVGAGDVVRGAMTIGQFGQFMLYAAIGALATTELLEVWGTLQRSSGGVSRLSQFHDHVAAEPLGDSGVEEPVGHGIVFEDVHFRYPLMQDKPVLEGFTMEVKPNQRVALVGPSGAGKSTVLSLILRLYDPSSGRILVGGRDSRDMDPRSLRQMVAIVPQSPVVFAQSARENIRYGRLDATDEEVEAAATAAEAHDFISRLPRGYDEPLGERGVLLSVGQQQRIGIARALLKGAPILLLDEATSALDAHSEHLVHDALHRLMTGRTTLIVAHRLATIRDADRIIVLNNGCVAETGSHHELSARNGAYAKLAKLQFTAAVPPA